MTTEKGGLKIQPRRLRQLFRKMVDVYSPPGKEEDIVSLLHGYLQRHHLPVVRQKVSDGRDNLIIEPDDVEPELVFVGHLDTVEAYDLDQFSFSQDGDEIFGLGTADMKGGCAAMIEAFTTLWQGGFSNLPVALALVVGEEETGDGSQRLVKEYDFSVAIVGEPTDLKPCFSHYGYLEIQLTTQGRRMHASLAPMGHNAVTTMLQLLMDLIHHLEANHQNAVYNIRDLTSSKSGFAVPDHCEAWLDVHVPAMSPMGDLVFELEEFIRRARKHHPESDPNINFTTIHSGYQLPGRGPIVEDLKEVYQLHQLPFSPQSFPSHSDANVLWEAGVKPILLGPGKLEAAHTPNESVSFSQVAKAAQMYVDLAMRFAQDRDDFEV